jgi:thiol-disulfide isomerase/thioredoxin
MVVEKFKYKNVRELKLVFAQTPVTINTKQMNKLTLFIFIAIYLFSCNQEKSINDVVLYGKIENPISDSLRIIDKGQKTIYVIRLNDDFTFRDTIKIAQGYYFLDDGNSGTQLYLKPGFALEVTFNENEFNKSIIYKGNGSDENNYLVRKAILTDSLRKFEDSKYYGQLEENAYKLMSDSIYNLRVTLFNKNSHRFDKEFIYQEKNTLKYQKLRGNSLYESTRRQVTGNFDFKVSTNYYPDLFKDIDLSDEKLLEILDYIHFVDSYLWQITNSQLIGNDSTDFYLTYLENIEKKSPNTSLKQELSYLIGKHRLDRTKELDKVYAMINANINNVDYINEIEPKYQTLSKIKKGALSPSFELPDANGEIIALADLKGKIVYIDIWSTTCSPCMAEIPFLNTLEKHYRGQDIEFVSINVIDSKERWQKIILEKEMKGIQLYAGDTMISFLKDYLVRGIPRFILIDRDGRIIDSSAKRPSNPKLKEQIDKLI